MVVLLIFPPAASVNGSRQSFAKTAKKSGARRVIFEGPCLICTAHDSKIVSDLANIAGADNVATAKRVHRYFSDVTEAIVETGIKTILPGEKFYVKVILTAKAPDYVERDIEFASAGVLVEKLAKINALPARSEHEADRVIMAVIGKRWAYVCAR